jgi:polyisoprenoid-binding protein YceI
MNRKTGVIVGLWIVAAGVCAAQTRNLPFIHEGSTMTYVLVHPLHTIEAVSKDVAYQLEAEVRAKSLKHVSGQVDVTTFDSGNSNRDSHAMEVIDAISFPEASFTSTSIEVDGDSLTIKGKLTLHGVTRDVVARARETWTPEKLVVTGGFAVSLTEFKIDRPSLLMIPVEDTLRFTFTAMFGLQ